MAKEHLSVRINEGTVKEIDEIATLQNVTRSSLVERFIEEGLRMEQHPGIIFISGPAGRRPAVTGTGLDVWEIISTVKANDNSIEDAAKYLNIAASRVNAALSYYSSNKEEIDRWIVHNERIYESELALSSKVQEALA